ncbi:hypothetical protein RclHR1_22190003 [Rhizophagus clarus]|uniref:Uncharacterized protein n=1 Tax=Rhizophagus clarus TaxID=94130 RepID=A0A2Z6R7J9_9GLOM|nr:hypothetical protein RclHR1_22190003 [Rhizophagus clarus]GES95356.1 hypothetical protein RCL_jg9659.t1 [Rhizophagus clarus]
MSSKMSTKNLKTTRSMTKTKNEVPPGSGLSTEQSILRTKTVLPIDNEKTLSVNQTPGSKEYNLQLPPEPTLTSISQDTNSINVLIHNPHMIVDHQDAAPIIQQHNNRTTTPEPQNQQTIPTMKTTQTLQIDHISLDDSNKNPLNIFYSFIIKEEFGIKASF